MNVTFSLAGLEEAADLAALHNSVAEDLTRRFGHGFWSSLGSERGVIAGMRHARVTVARVGGKADQGEIIGNLRLQTKKPWAIDVSYFTPAKKPIYVTGMAVLPSMQRKGIGRALVAEAVRQVRDWPADAIRLDAFNADAGAGGFYRKCGFREVASVVYRNDPLLYFELVLQG